MSGLTPREGWSDPRAHGASVTRSLKALQRGSAGEPDSAIGLCASDTDNPDFTRLAA